MTRESRRTNVVIIVSLLMIAAAFAIYATMVLRWFAATPPQSAAQKEDVSRERELEAARSEFREKFLDCGAHLRLSEALWTAGRPIDSFYVMRYARQLFSPDVFRAAHAEIVVRAGGPAERTRAELQGQKDVAKTIRTYGEIVRYYPDSPEARDALDQLSRIASGDENAPGGEAAHLARSALIELYQLDPKNSQLVAALGASALMRGDVNTAVGVANEALEKHMGQAGAARILGMIALKNHDADGALNWLTAAWEQNPNDLYSAAKLAEIYQKRRDDPEGSLPFYLALYRQNPDYYDDAPAENKISAILDSRRDTLLANAPVEALGSRFALDDASLRAGACIRAGLFKDPRWINALAHELDDDVDLVRRSADNALYQIAKENPAAVRAHRAEWIDSPRMLVRIRALNLFADLDGKNALPDAIAALQDPNPAVRVYAKIMVLDHYFKRDPDAQKAEAKYLAKENDAGALAILKRADALSR